MPRVLTHALLRCRYVAIVVQGAFVIFFRLCFYIACKYKENASR